MPDTTPLPSACYQHGQSYLVFAIVSTTLFTAMDVGSVYVAYWNIDGSFPHPRIHALVHGIFWSCWVLLGLWMITAYFRERLFITSDALIQHGVLTNRKISIADVTHVTWKGIPSTGKIIVQSRCSSVKIKLSDFSSDQRHELIRFFSSTFAANIQVGWLRFSSFSEPAHVANPKSLRQNAITCAVLLLTTGVILTACAVFGLGAQWYVSGAISILGGLWYLWRIYRRHTQTAG